jgi:hypothetical protein
MSATHDTHNWELDSMEAALVKRRERECRERGEAMEREAEARANIRAFREYRKVMLDR